MSRPPYASLVCVASIDAGRAHPPRPRLGTGPTLATSAYDLKPPAPPQAQWTFSSKASARRSRSSAPIYLGGHSTTTLPLTAAILALSVACASSMFFLVPRPNVVVTEELIAKAEEEESGML
jgi:hypothetical protein